MPHKSEKWKVVDLYQVQMGKFRATQNYNIGDEFTEEDMEQVKANAALIAAAPELLEACKKTLKEMELQHVHFGPCAKSLRDVIAKAELK